MATVTSTVSCEPVAVNHGSSANATRASDKRLKSLEKLFLRRCLSSWFPRFLLAVRYSPRTRLDEFGSLDAIEDDDAMVDDGEKASEAT